MHDLRVTFSAAPDGGYLARLVESGAGAGDPAIEIPFQPFLTEDDYENLRWYLEDFMDLPDGGAVVRAKRVERDLDAWGKKLYEALFPSEESRQLLERLLASPEPRELTIATQDAALLRLPWELLADKAGLHLAPRVSVRRQLETPADTPPRAAELPLRILYIVSRPADAGFLDPRLTAKAMFAALDPLGGAARVDFCRPPTFARVEELLRDGDHAGDPYDLVHFDGHGTFLPHSQIGALLFEKDDDGFGPSAMDLIPADRLGNLLASYRIPLVVLEACRSATVGKAAVFRSVAPRLIQAGVGSVLSMGHAVHVEAARLLLDRFYRELARGTTIGHAVAEARKVLAANQARWIETGPNGRRIDLRDWFLPHLYQRSHDDALVPPDAAAKVPVRLFDVFLSHQFNDLARVEALARALDEKHGVRVWLDKWQIAPGTLRDLCEQGIRASRITVIAVSNAALGSDWVKWEAAKHTETHPQGDRLIPIKLEPLVMPPEWNSLLWVDFTDPAKDVEKAAELAALIRMTDAEDALRHRGFRNPPGRGESGAFPPPPAFGFQGRALELYDLERRFHRSRGIVLHAMGGMGKTALATEAAGWWTRSGLFRDGACFLSFEQFASADRAIQLFGTYLEGLRFEQLPSAEQRRRAIELLRDKEVLFVWDNFESALPQFAEDVAGAANPYTDEERHRLAELFRDLTEGPGKGCLLVTCRPGETGLPGAERMELEGLARADSLWLLASILQRDGLTLADPRFARERLDPLLADLADHPLSLELVGPHLKTLTPEAIRADFGNLLLQVKQKAHEGRNESLLASLEFSRKHLSPAAREALPWLGLFRGGAFEIQLLDVSQLTPESWEPIRRELEGIALLRVLADIQIADRPFLRFHPTLAAAVADGKLGESAEIRTRYVQVYLALMRGLDKALRGSQSRIAIEILDREEANYRIAVQWAVADRQFREAAALGHTFRDYLERSGRTRERDAWVEWLKGAVAKDGFTDQAAAYERQHAWSRFTQGDPQGAVDQLQQLIERLAQTTEFDPAFQLALATGTLGQVFVDAGAYPQAIPVCQDAIGQWEVLVKKTGGQPWKELLSTPDYKKAAGELGNLSAAMGDLANALRGAGRHDKALDLAEQCVQIRQTLGHQREVAATHGRCAQILRAAGRYDEADQRYDLALAAARAVGDKELEGTTLQHQGILADDRSQFDRAGRLYRQALQSFQEAGDEGSIMRTYNLLGVVDQKTGRLADARSWYEKSRELAQKLGDRPGVGNAAQNLGIVSQLEGEAARERGDEEAARRHFEDARRSVEKSLRVKQALGNRPDEASSWGQLARIQLRLGDFAAAERHAHEALKIHEDLGLKEAWKVYNILSEIAEARGDTTAAAEWARKRDELLEELKRRAGGGSASLPPAALRGLQALTIACAQARSGEGTLGPAEEEYLAQLEQAPEPNPAFAGFLRDIAANRPTPIPVGLPNELADWLNEMFSAG